MYPSISYPSWRYILMIWAVTSRPRGDRLSGRASVYILPPPYLLAAVSLCRPTAELAPCSSLRERINSLHSPWIRRWAAAAARPIYLTCRLGSITDRPSLHPEKLEKICHIIGERMLRNQIFYDHNKSVLSYELLKILGALVAIPIRCDIATRTTSSPSFLQASAADVQAPPIVTCPATLERLLAGEETGVLGMSLQFLSGIGAHCISSHRWAFNSMTQLKKLRWFHL